MRWKALSIAVSNNNFLSVLSDVVGDNRFVAQIDATLCNTLSDLLAVPNYAPRDSASLSGDPMWQLPSLALQENSPAINQGRNLPFIPTDFFGNPRVGNHCKSTALKDVGKKRLFITQNHATFASNFQNHSSIFAFKCLLGKQVS